MQQPQQQAPSLSLSASSFNFNTVVEGHTQTQTLQVSNTGNAPLQLSSLSVSNSQFSVAGPSAPQTIAPSASLAYTLTFSPTTAGSASATLNINSNASPGSVSVSLTGDGVAATVQHTVNLSWNASTSSVIGYRVYRKEPSDISYTALTGAALDALTYADSTVASGITYYYVVTAVDAAGDESAPSNQATAVVPTP